MKKYVKMGISAVLVIAVIVGCYYYMTHRKTVPAEDDVEITQLQQVLSKQLDHAYPPTPREVIKFYNRIIECAYGSEYNEEQFQKLMTQARKLMDVELLENNPQDTYQKQLLQEITSYQENSIKILQTRVCDSDEVRYKEIEGRKCAYVQAIYFMKQGKDFIKTYQDYLLRQDKEKKWKIVAYHLTQAEQTDEPEE
ncbi:hypothetical protein C823_006687 [Eubacterium plexicaudatum ASF492]|uniref:Lipoprotein n=1 Tax=Eubacterium plexicaudatum ASF492 TaxID=1235802 RepID=N2ACH3_9FIRM|nr:hypothetical protein C823_006687 [Eubacterium plexicaudatum ASF492]